MDKKVTTVNLMIIATGKYVEFLEGNVAGIENFFMPDCRVNICIFTNKVTAVRHDFVEAHVIEIPNERWPLPTLNRFYYMKNNLDLMPEADYYFYVDADTKMVDYIPSDILSESVAVRHCGYIGERGTYEERLESACYVGPNEGENYFGGGFWGFSRTAFVKMLDVCTEMLDKDTRNGIVPIWHDESIINRYFIDYPPTKKLMPSYHYPENNAHIYRKWANIGLGDFGPKILLLNKDHIKYRSWEEK